MKKLLIIIPIALMLCTPVFGKTVEDVMEEYNISSINELDEALFQYSYLKDDLGKDVFDAEEALYYYSILEDFDMVDDADLEEALYFFGEYYGDDLYNYEGDEIHSGKSKPSVIEKREREKKNNPTPTATPTPIPTPTPTEKVINTAKSWGQKIIVAFPFLAIVVTIIKHYGE